jgi:hypothetical protein
MNDASFFDDELAPADDRRKEACAFFWGNVTPGSLCRRPADARTGEPACRFPIEQHRDFENVRADDDERSKRAASRGAR